jgi:OOP family OmpA-OmpF porin
VTLSARRATLALAAVVALSACSVTAEADDPTDAPTTASPTPSADPTSASPTPAETTDGPDLPTVPGYGVGEFPPVPLFVLPDLALLEASMSGFTPELTELVGDYPGLTISPARCDEAGELVSGPGSLLLYGDGSGTYTGPDGETYNYGDGSGRYTIDGVEVVNYGDGSGSYEGGGVSITNYGDGSGRYSDEERSVVVYGDGSGEETTSEGTITNYGDGSGRLDGGGVEIVNYGDGSGRYSDDEIEIVNYGDGTGTVNGTPIEVEPIDEVATIGSFPPMGALEPITACGTTITLDSAVLFDIDQYSIRPDAAAVLDSLAEALVDGDVPEAQIAGHTDSVRDEAWNQQLSEDRAASVADALTERGVTSELSTVGYGETRPVASNDTDAGRQQNRRVEIFIPAF